jgi:secondary thiamine-phosphate synthase enzyme
MIYKLDIKTNTRVEFLDITPQVKDMVAKSRISDGVCYVFVPHTTAAVTVNEHADSDVMADMRRQLEILAPEKNNFRHSEGNSDAHIKASLVGSSVTLFVEAGKLVLGTWQGIFFCEFDGPRNRTVMIKITSDNT